jgi:hypothetical protein
MVTVVDAGERLALYWEHIDMPTDSTCTSPVAGHAARRQPATIEPIEFCVGPHWQAKSFNAQPAAVIAEERHNVAHAGSPSRTLCAAAGEVIHATEKSMHSRSNRKLIFNQLPIMQVRRFILVGQSGKIRAGEPR